MAKSITLKEAQQVCRELGYTLKRTGADHKELVVKKCGSRNPDEGYFTDDIQEAVDTCKAIYEAEQAARQDRDLAPSIAVGEQQ
jgi:hypothetical protein